MTENRPAAQTKPTRRPLRWCGNESPRGPRAQTEHCTLPTEELEEAPRAATSPTGLAQLLLRARARGASSHGSSRSCVGSSPLSSPLGGADPAWALRLRRPRRRRPLPWRPRQRFRRPLLLLREGLLAPRRLRSRQSVKHFVVVMLCYVIISKFPIPVERDFECS